MWVCQAKKKHVYTRSNIYEILFVLICFFFQTVVAFFKKISNPVWSEYDLFKQLNFFHLNILKKFTRWIKLK